MQWNGPIKRIVRRMSRLQAHGVCIQRVLLMCMQTAAANSWPYKHKLVCATRPTASMDIVLMEALAVVCVWILAVIQKFVRTLTAAALQL